MYETADFVLYDDVNDHLHVFDYKHGIGVVVSASYNTQTLYYAVGVLEQLQLWSHVKTITTYIVQPRSFHPDGPVREHTYSRFEVLKWLGSTLLPAMRKAEVSRDTVAGEHCRFCPARSHNCPALMKNMEALQTMSKLIDEKEGAAHLTPEEIGRVLSVFSIAKIQEKSIREVALARLNKNQAIPGWKMVSGRMSRIWKDDTARVAIQEFGPWAFLDSLVEMA